MNNAVHPLGARLKQCGITDIALDQLDRVGTQTQTADASFVEAGNLSKVLPGAGHQIVQNPNLDIRMKSQHMLNQRSTDKTATACD